MTEEPTLADDVDAYLRKTGMGPTYFGQQAVGNPNLVKRLRAGGNVYATTERKVRAYMADNPPPDSEGAAA